MSIHARLVNGPRAGEDIELPRPLLAVEFAEIPDMEVQEIFSEKAPPIPKLRQHRYKLAKVLYVYEYAGWRET